MSFVINAFRELTKKDKDFANRAEATSDIMYPTGFPSFDAINGYVAEGKDPKTGEIYKYFNIGICDGSINLVIARAGAGKSTFCTQAGPNIIRRFKNGAVFEENIESGMLAQRRMQLAQFTEAEMKERYIIRNAGITIENFFKRVKAIHDLKVAHADELMYDTGLHDIYGNPIKKLEPTVVLLDSLAMISTAKVADGEELGGQMSQTAAAKAIAATLRALVPACKEANIIMFIINHITEKVEINPMAHSKSKTIYLNANETLPRGVTPIYVANNVIRIDDGNKLKPTEGFGINGAIAKFSLVKSRSARANAFTNLIFDQNNGFDPDISMIQFMKDNDMLNGAGTYYFGDRTDLKFMQKNFKAKLKENEEFRKVFEEYSIECITKYIAAPKKYGDCGYSVDGILDQISGQKVQDAPVAQIEA